MAKPREREFLKKCAENDYLIKTMGNLSRRMSDQGRVLRFLAFYGKYPGQGVNCYRQFS